MLNIEKYKEELDKYASEGVEKAMFKVFFKYAPDMQESADAGTVFKWFTSPSERTVPKLTSREKFFIKNIVEPFVNNYEVSIVKSRYPICADSTLGNEILRIEFQNPAYEEDYHCLEFPQFVAGKYYKNMIPEVEYSLTQLGVYITPKIDIINKI